MGKERMGVKDQISKAVGKSVNEGMPLFGVFEVKQIRDGEIIDERVVKNVITDTGKADVAALMLADITTITKFDYIAIGTGTTAAAATDTALGNECTATGGERATAAGTRVTTNTANDTAQLIVTYNFTGSYAVTESGVFNAASITTSDMLCRQTFSAVNVQNGDSLQITWKIAVSI